MQKVTFIGFFLFNLMFSEKGMLCCYHELILYFLKFLCGRVPVNQKYLLVVLTVKQLLEQNFGLLQQVQHKIDTSEFVFVEFTEQII